MNKKTIRRKSAHDRLVKQLKSGQKAVKKTYLKAQLLTDKDKARITREIETLKSKI